jgi:hypothetical protein
MKTIFSVKNMILAGLRIRPQDLDPTTQNARLRNTDRSKFSSNFLLPGIFSAKKCFKKLKQKVIWNHTTYMAFIYAKKIKTGSKSDRKGPDPFGCGSATHC